MATGTNPLQRSTIETLAREPRSEVTAPATNTALQVAQALGRLSPVASAAMKQVAADKQRKADAEAKRDALVTNGAAYADAVRDGRLRKTQNPWYIQAYNREAAAISSLRSLQALQTSSATWDSVDDPAAFETQWREEVGKLAEGFENEDAIAGFVASEGQITSQVLQVNVARNTRRIEGERTANLGALAADALTTALRANGGALSPNQAWQAMLPARQQWFATGGDELGWIEITRGAVGTAARQTEDASVMDLLKAPEMRFGPTDAGDGFEAGAVGDTPPEYSGPRTIELPPSEVAGAEPGSPPPARQVRVSVPVRKGFELKSPLAGVELTQATSGFGLRQRPTAGASKNHKALDLPAAAGTPVLSVSAGKVTFAGKKGGYGNRVEVDYGGGVVSSYSHLSSINVQPGQIITAGASVGGVGRTGTATGNHLHWEVIVNGQKVNPLQFAGATGGDFDGPATAEAPPAESFAGFPGLDQPFEAEQQAPRPRDHVGVGPAIYDMPGASAQIEQERFYIQQAAESKAGQKLRILNAQRAARGQEAVDALYASHGTGLMTGQVTRDTIIKELAGKGYSAPEIAVALNNLRNTLSDSAGIADAQIAARAADPGQANRTLDLRVKGMQNGYTPEYRDEVGQAVLNGDISGNDAQSMLGGALDATNRLRSEGRQEEADARQESRMDRAEAASGLDKYSELRDLAKSLTSLVLTTGIKVAPQDRGTFEDEDYRGRMTQTIVDAMQAHLAANPGDWAGAEAIGRARAAAAIRSLTASAGGGTAKPSAPAKPSGTANPLRK